MQRNHYRVIYLLLLVLLYSCGASRIEFKDSDSLLAVEAKIKQTLAQQVPPGVSIIVVKKNQVLYSKGFGYADFTNRKKATPKTTYQWWSLTKPFTATAILQLQEKNLLDIDDPVHKHLSFFDVNYKKKTDRPITIRDLLSHSAGLKDIGNQIIGWIHYDEQHAYNQTQLVKEKLPDYKKLVASPGQEGRYTNLGYMLLAAIIEKTSQQSYDAYISEHILKPLEMNGTGFQYSGLAKEHVAVGSHPKDLMSFIAFRLIEKDKAIREKKDDIYYFNNIYANQQGSTGLIGSTENLAHFLMALLNNGHWNGQQILSPESVKLMFAPQVPIKKSPAPKLDNPHFGLSWFIHNHHDYTALTHGGAGAAFVAQMRIYPERDLGIAVLCNSTYLGNDMGTTFLDKLTTLKW